MGETTKDNERIRKTRERNAKCARPFCTRNAVFNSEFCILHAEIENKDLEEFWEEFREYLETVLEEQEQSENPSDVSLICANFIFPPQIGAFLPEEIPVNIDFSFAEFYGGINLFGRRFKGRVAFFDTKFNILPAGIERLVPGYRKYPRISEKVDFSEVIFSDDATFVGSEFQYPVDFSGAHFRGASVFGNAIFLERADFGGIEYEGNALFDNAVFNNTTRFCNSTFARRVVFDHTVFNGEVVFDSIFFEGGASFIGAKFGSFVEFKRVWKKLKSKPTFKNEAFVVPDDKEKDKAAEVWLANAYFEKPQLLTFKDIDLGKWVFAETPALSEARFIDTAWVGSGSPKRKHTEDENLAITYSYTDLISFDTAAEVYRRIRLNYESHLAFEQASDFHIGQMEMLLADPGFPDSKKFFLRLYRLLSNFGESVFRPLGWLVVIWYVSFLALTATTLTDAVPGLIGIFKGDFVMPWQYVTECAANIQKGFLIRAIETVAYFWSNIWFALKNFIAFPARESPAIEFIINTGQKLGGGALMTFTILALRRAFRR